MIPVRARSVALFLTAAFLVHAQADLAEWSGIYPHLAFFNKEGECGTGAVVPWADRLWCITYAPHRPTGSSDKLYEIDPALNLTVRPESVGGTCANRMIHPESNQLFIGPYVIDSNRQVRVIPASVMYGRLTGNARHLSAPAQRICYATMEEGFYDVDVSTLEVRTLYHDEQVKDAQPKADLPGYHGKGFYSGQGRLVYSNNGEHGQEALRNPFVPSGVLAEWSDEAWHVISRNQFTEVTGPGGITGNHHPETDPVWALGWDAKSVLLMVLDHDQWHHYRLPKASHSYDGAHGWNTEWPRIRDIGEGDDSWLMTMHGLFWRFPKSFCSSHSAGLTPRSTFLKVVGDFCRWGDRVVFGCDDAAKSEFLNKRRAKGEIAPPQSQSNLWFLRPGQLDQLGPVIARGAVWLEEAVSAGQPSDAYLFSGLKRRALHLAQSSGAATPVTLEIDRNGTGTWEPYRHIDPAAYQWIEFPDDAPGVWIRLNPEASADGITAWFTGSGPDSRESGSNSAPPIFDGVARAGDTGSTGGLVRARDGGQRTLQFAASGFGAYELTADLKLRPTGDAAEFAWLQQHAAIPSREGVIDEDQASIIYIDDQGRRFRLPRSRTVANTLPGRLCREVATERDLFHCAGTFFELPAENAAGFCRVRPVSSHNLAITDYCSYRGLLVMSGVNLQTAGENRHLIRSEDGKTGLWVGAIDDLWQLGKPTGVGGPWLNSSVRAGEISDPYLMTGYDRKTLRLTANSPTEITAQIDITGTGLWSTFRTFALPGNGEIVSTEFPRAFQAYWIRFVSATEAVVTAQLDYE